MSIAPRGTWIARIEPHKDLALAILAGFALALASAPRDLPPFTFAFAALLALALETEPDRPASPKRALLVGLVAGFACNVIALSWVVGLLQAHARFPLVAAIPVGMMLELAQSAPFALGAAGAAFLRRRIPGLVAFPAAMTVAFSLVPALFPWRPSETLVPFVRFVQIADVGGAPLLDAFLFGLGAVIAELVRRRGASSRRLVVAGASMIALPLLYGAIRLPQIELARASAPVLRIGVVQPNVGILEKHDPRLRTQHLERLRRATRALEAEGAALVVWPESAYPFPIPRERREDPPGVASIRVGGTRGPVLFGAITESGVCDRWNSVVAMDADGRFVGRTDKVRLLAFGETVPFWHWLPPLQEMFPCPGLRAGDAPQAIDVAGARIGVLNCYEDVLASYARALVHDRPELFVNVTNDAWFGRTAEPFQHAMVARLRAIETRRDLVRSVNTGVSEHILATGEVASETATFVEARFVAAARRLDLVTPWVRFGDLTTPALLLAAVATWLRSRRARSDR